jgi:long-chain acyl-CoA synthetase
MSRSLPPKPRFQRLLHQSLIRAAYDCPNTTALITDKASVTYGRLLEYVQQCASALVARGVARGDRVAIYADNTLECVVALWAALWAGAAFVMVNPQTKSDKLKYVLNKSGARCFVTDEHLSKEWGPVLSECGSLTGVLCSNWEPANVGTSAQPGIEDFWKVVQNESPMENAVFCIPLDLAALIFTSGSTGLPKGVTMTHQSMVFARDSITEYLRLSQEERIINLLPLAFDYGLYQCLIASGLGATLLLERSFTYPGMVFEKMDKHGVTVFPGVPTIYSTLISMHRKTPLCFPQVRRVTNTAAALPQDYVPALRQIFPNALIFAMYGLTECKRVSYLEPELIELKTGSVGKPIPGTEMFLLSAQGESVPPGQSGILHIRGPHLMLGYWEDPERTARMIKPGKLPGERVLCTQDWFSMDADGFFYFKGRSDDIIKTRGEKVSPVEVENVLYSLKGIREAAVIGVPNENLGQAIKAFVVLEANSALTPKDIQRHCAARLENFMVPQQIEFSSGLPKTDTGKIKKDVLR